MDFTKSAIYKSHTKRSGNCLIWLGRIRKNNRATTPLVNINGVTYFVTRLVTGAQPGERVYRRCTNAKCVRRTHLQAAIPAIARSASDLKTGGHKKREFCKKGHRIHERQPTIKSASSRVVRYCPVCTGRLPIAERRARRKNHET